MNNCFNRFVAGFVALSAVSTGLASADIVDMRFEGTGSGQSVRVTNVSSTFNVFAGQLRHFLSNGTGVAANLRGEMITYCSDLSQYVSRDTQRYTVQALALAPAGNAMGADKARAIASIYDYAMGFQLTSSTSNDLATAFQLAVWEIVSDFNYAIGSSSLSVSSGNFRATKTNGQSLSSGVSNLLNSFFTHTNNSSFSTSGIAALTSERFQDQLITIPSPGVGVLAGFGVMMIGRRHRRA